VTLDRLMEKLGWVRKRHFDEMHGMLCRAFDREAWWADKHEALRAELAARESLDMKDDESLPQYLDRLYAIANGAIIVTTDYRQAPCS